MAHPPTSPLGDDPWSLLGLTRSFAVDRAAVRAAYLARAAELHPDASTLDPDAAERATAALNEAKRILDDPELRASELLRLLGGPSKEADRSLPPGFLMEMMEVREEIESDQRAAVGGWLDKWQRWGDERRRGHIDAAGAMFAQSERAGTTPALLKQIRTELNAWRYVERMLEQIAVGE
jgi:molecular chaperone HscB